MLKFCTVASVVPWQGQSLYLKANTAWPADDPFVVAHPELFADAPEVIETSSGARFRGVEQATRAPGEKRGAVR